MLAGYETITDFEAGRERIRARRFGVIETVGGQFHALHLRPWPKLVSLPEIWPLGSRYHTSGEPDRCLLFYNQPWRMPNFLALKYVVSTSGTSYATFRAALKTLDAIAELKQIDAIVCDAGNVRLSDRLDGAVRLGATQAAALAPQFHPAVLRQLPGNFFSNDFACATNPPALLAEPPRIISLSIW